jgi:hypothetical protein
MIIPDWITNVTGAGIIVVIFLVQKAQVRSKEALA